MLEIPVRYQSVNQPVNIILARHLNDCIIMLNTHTDTLITSLSVPTIRCTKSRDNPTPEPHALQELMNISQKIQ